ncbi:MAG: putative DNA binding domain-containing protein [Myxococcota bacterium]|nr:putative DNA binding domain-containing protein [Myxococcota bacterium]
MTTSSELDAALLAIQNGQTARSLESQALEFKEEGTSEKDTVRLMVDAALCFANAAGGSVVLGVRDGVGGVAGFVGTTLEAKVLKRRIYELSRPPLLVDVQERMVNSNRLLVVHVPESPDIHADTQGRALRRLATDCLPMSPNEQLRLREERHGVDWSASPSKVSWTAASKVALESARQRLASFPDQRSKLSRLTDRDLLSALGVIGGDGRFSRGGELLFCATAGTQPAIVYQYRGTPGGEPKAIERLASPLVLALAKAMELVQVRRSLTPINLPDGQQIHIADFPELAVREALVNAVVHRDHHLPEPVSVEHSQEVLVITSPGPLVSGVTPSNILTHPSKPRNQQLARAIRQLGLAEEVGRGVDRMFREMIRSGRDVPRIDESFDQVRISLVGGAPNTQIARYVAQLPVTEQDDTDTLLVLFRLCSTRTVDANSVAPLVQKSMEESESVLRRLSTDRVGLLEPTRQTARRAHPSYRLRGEALKALGSAVPYQRRTIDEIDRKVLAHVVEYGKITNRTVQNLFDLGIQRARAVLADLVQRQILVKVSDHQRGPGVEYGPGLRFPLKKKVGRSKGHSGQLNLKLPPEKKKNPRSR